MTMTIGIRESALEALRMHREAPRPSAPADEADELLAREVRRLLGAPVPVFGGEAEAEGLRFRLGEGGRLTVSWDCVFCGRPSAARSVRERYEARERFCARCPGRGRP